MKKKEAHQIYIYKRGGEEEEKKKKSLARKKKNRSSAMARKKVKVPWIASDRARKAFFQKRREALFKKAMELCELCGVEAAIAIFCQDEEPAFWPSKASVEELYRRYVEIPAMERSKKMLNQDNFMKDRIAKIEEQTKKCLKRSREMEMNDLMYQIVSQDRLCELSVSDLTKVMEFLKEKHREIHKRAVHLQELPPLFGNGTSLSSSSSLSSLPYGPISISTPEGSVRSGGLDNPITDKWIVDKTSGSSGWNDIGMQQYKDLQGSIPSEGLDNPIIDKWIVDKGSSGWNEIGTQRHKDLQGSSPSRGLHNLITDKWIVDQTSGSSGWNEIGMQQYRDLQGSIPSEGLDKPIIDKWIVDKGSSGWNEIGTQRYKDLQGSSPSRGLDNPITDKWIVDKTSGSSGWNEIGMHQYRDLQGSVPSGGLDNPIIDKWIVDKTSGSSGWNEIEMQQYKHLQGLAPYKGLDNPITDKWIVDKTIDSSGWNEIWMHRYKDLQGLPSGNSDKEFPQDSTHNIPTAEKDIWLPFGNIGRFSTSGIQTESLPGVTDFAINKMGSQSGFNIVTSSGGNQMRLPYRNADVGAGSEMNLPYGRGGGNIDLAGTANQMGPSDGFNSWISDFLMAGNNELGLRYGINDSFAGGNEMGVPHGSSTGVIVSVSNEAGLSTGNTDSSTGGHRMGNVVGAPMEVLHADVGPGAASTSGVKSLGLPQENFASTSGGNKGRQQYDDVNYDAWFESLGV